MASAGFPLGCTPHPGESLPGFLVRLAHRMRINDVRKLAGELGVRQPVIAPSEAVLNRLAQLASCSPSDLSQLAYQPAERALVRYPGSSISPAFLSLMPRRYCPKCLAEAAWHRAAWDFALLTCCPKHGILLQAHCSFCDRPVGWSAPNIAICVCGRTLADGLHLCGNSDDIRAASMISDLACRHPVPWLAEEFLGHSRAELVQAVFSLGILIFDWRQPRSMAGEVAQDARSLSIAVALGVGCLADWPKRLRGHLEHLIGTTKGAPNRRMRQALEKFQLESKDVLPSVILDEV